MRDIKYYITKSVLTVVNFEVGEKKSALGFEPGMYWLKPAIPGQLA